MESLKELKLCTGLIPYSLIEKVGLRKICEEVLPKTKNASYYDSLPKNGTVEVSMIFLERFYGLKFDHFGELYHGQNIYDEIIGKPGLFNKYLKRVQEDSHFI